MDIEEVKAVALREIKEEDFRKAVDLYKDKLRKRRTFWDWLFPFKIVILKKEKWHDRH